jgi:hypothetical protein
MGIEPARPRILAAVGVRPLAFQGRPRFPGWVPRLAPYSCERSLFAHVLGTGPSCQTTQRKKNISGEADRSRCMGIEPARPRILAAVGVRPLAFQGRPRFPGWVPRLAPYSCERSLFARVLGTGPRRVPPFDSHAQQMPAAEAFEGARWRRCMGIEPTRRGVSPGATALKAAERTSALAPPRGIILRRGFSRVQA